MPTRGKTPRDEFDHHEMESRSSVDQHKNQKGGNKMKRRIEMSEIPIGIAASALGAVEFVMKDAKAALTTMSDNPHVLMVPIAIGGRGRAGVYKYYHDYFLAQLPADIRPVPISQVVGKDILAEEAVITLSEGKGPLSRRIYLWLRQAVLLGRMI